MASYKGHLSIVQYLVDTCHVPPDQPDNSNNTALLYSAMGGHSDLVEFFIERNCNTSQINCISESLSLLACQSGELALVHKLESLNLFSSDDITKSGAGILHYTCRSMNNKSVDLFKYLLNRYQLSIDVKDRYGKTPLHIASWFASSSVVEYIVSIQGNEALLVTDNDYRSCLHDACDAGILIPAGIVYSKLTAQSDAPVIGITNTTRIKQNIDFIKRNERVKMFSSLLKKVRSCLNFAINVTINDGWSLFYFASRCGSTLLVKTLEEYNINCTLDNDGMSPVHYAAWPGSTSVLSYIISQYNLNANDTDYTYGRTPLVYSCRSGSIDSVKYLINNHNSDPNITDKYGMTCLHQSCRNGHIDITQYLIEVQHCDINKTDNEVGTLVHHAAWSGNFDLVEYLITEQGLSPTAVTKNGLTALHYASLSLNLSLVKELITTYQLDPHQADSNGKLPIHYAAESGDILLLELYVKVYKCSLSLTDNKGWNILHFSSTEGHTHFIKHLVENHQLDLCAVNDEGMAPIHLACSNGRLNLVQYIIEHVPSSLELPVRGHGRTPFLTAVYFNQLEVIKYLISKKYNLSATDNEGCIVFHTACSNGHIDVFRYLSSIYPQGVNVMDNRGRSLLHAACEGGDIGTVRNLIETHGLDPLAEDKDGITCLHLLAERKTDGESFLMRMFGDRRNVDIYQYLRHHIESNPVPKDKSGCTPLHYASRSDNIRMVRYLIETFPCTPDDPDNNGYTSVHAACEAGSMELVQYFLTELNCNALAETDDLKTMLYFASKSSNLELVRFLVDTFSLKPHPHDIDIAQSVNPDSSVVKYLQEIHYDLFLLEQSKVGGYHEKLEGQRIDPQGQVIVS